MHYGFKMSASNDQVLHATRKKEIERGRAAYLEDRFKTAVQSFTKAINSCPCADHRKRTKCQCKKYEAVLRLDKPYALYDEVMKPCCCQNGDRIYTRCNDPIHLQGLEYRAAVFSATDKINLAQRDAEWAIELYPIRLESYLRLYGIAVKQKNAIFAWQVLSAGVEVGRKHRLAASDKFQKLLSFREPLHRRFAKKDPVEATASELRDMIFGYLDTTELCGVLRVSRLWHNYLTSASILWRDLEFTGRPPGTQAVKNLVKYSAYRYKTLKFLDTKWLGFAGKQPHLLMGSRETTRLAIQGAPIQAQIPTLSWQLSKLTHLTVVSFCGTVSMLNTTLADRFLSDLLRRNSNQLDYLDIQTDHLNIATDWPRLPQLQYARIVHEKPSVSQNWVQRKLSLLRIKMPKLKQLWFSVKHASRYRPVHDPDPVALRQRDLNQISEVVVKPKWSDLEGLVFSPGIRLTEVLPGLDAKLRFLHQLNDQQGLGVGSLLDEVVVASRWLSHLLPKVPLEDMPPFFRLQTLAVPMVWWWDGPDNRADGEISRLALLMKDYVEAGTLKMLEIHVVASVNETDGYVMLGPYISSLRSVRILSLKLTGSSAVPHSRRAEFPRVLAKAVRDLPYLETLELYWDEDDPHTRELTQVAGSLLECLFSLDEPGASPVKTVYSNIFSGVELDMIRATTAAKGANMYPMRIPPPKFPLPIEPDPDSKTDGAGSAAG